MSPPLDQLIRSVRNKRVILDADLAAIYGVPTKALKQAIRRNPERFPEDFAFQLSLAEWRELRVRIASENNLSAHNQEDASNRSQFVTGHLQSILKSSVVPFAFTDHGALMAANLLRSSQAVQMSIYVVRAFGKLRELLLSQTEILKRLAEIDTQLLGHDKALRALWREIQPLLDHPPTPEKPEIGFHVREDTPEYRAKPCRSNKA